MADLRVEKLAQVLVNYSLELKVGDEFCLETSPLAEPLTLAVYREALLAGAHVSILNNPDGVEEFFYNNAKDFQLEHLAPFRKMVVEEFSARMIISAPSNTRELSGVAPASIRRAARAKAGVFDTFWKRSSSGDFKWCDTVYPTAALAQEAGMCLRDYEDFVYTAGMLDLPDPVAAWQAEKLHQEELTRWLAGREQVHLSGRDIDLSLSINGRTFEACYGKYNFPDGEIATSPVEDSANGWVRFSYPAIHTSKEVEDIELWFEDGRIVKEKAGKGWKLLTTLLETDQGSRYLGELGIGTNYKIQRFTKNLLFDEKMGGTIHLAAGASLPETGGKNQSAIHWDMLCDMSESEIMVDGDIFYKDGKFVI
jgi:aminopeptidase